MPDKNGKFRSSDVGYFSVSYKPRAECRGDGTDACSWTYREHSVSGSTKASVMAKQHVMGNPTHIVRTVQETVSEYAIPDSMLVAQGLLSAEEKITEKEN